MSEPVLRCSPRLLAALARLSSGYYTFLRLAVCAGAAFNAFAQWIVQALRWLGGGFLPEVG